METNKEITVRTRLGEQSINPDRMIDFPHGLIGYEDKRKFSLIQLKPGSPFFMLQSMEDPDLGLLVADPFGFFPAYQVRMGNAEQALLHVDNIAQLVVLVTVNIPHGKPERTALNLTGPIFINHEIRVGMQVPQADGGYPPRFYIYSQEQPAQDE